MSTIAANHLPTEILLVLDRSIAGDQTGWRNLISAVVNQIGANGARYDWGLYMFPKDGPACGAATVTAGADLGFGSDDSFHLIAHVVAAGVAGNGTPTAAAIGAGAAYLHTVVDQSPKFMMLVTDGAPTCAGTIGAPLSDDAAMAQADAVAAIAAAAAEGFPTVVVAPSTTTAAGDVAALNALALAGGYARQGDDQVLHGVDAGGAVRRRPAPRAVLFRWPASRPCPTASASRSTASASPATRST